jgi:hypothetical protein
MSELSAEDRRRWFRLRLPGDCHDNQLLAERFSPPTLRRSTITSGAAPNTPAPVPIRLFTLRKEMEPGRFVWIPSDGLVPFSNKWDCRPTGNSVSARQSRAIVETRNYP